MHCSLPLVSILLSSCFRIAVAVKLSPEALVGRKLRVYWPEDDGWFLGAVAHYNAQTGQHRVYLKLHLHTLYAQSTMNQLNWVCY